MIERIEYSKPYKLQLLPLYGATVYNCFVIGETNIDNVSNNEEDFNIYEQFFAPFGYGLGSYYGSIIPTTKIFICNQINSFSPLEVDRDKKFFIPESLIDKENSNEYVECGNISFTIYPIVKSFESIENQEKFLNDTKEKMRKKLSELIDFSILTNEIDSYVEPIYLTREEINDIEERRMDMYKKHIQTQESLLKFQNNKDRQYNELLVKLKKQIEDYENKSAELDQTKTTLRVTIGQYEALIRDLNNS